jgi:hypothetical protein
MFEQFWNACVPMELTLGGIFNVLSCEQPKNAAVPINNKLPPSATAGIFAQSRNAEVFIV